MVGRKRRFQVALGVFVLTMASAASTVASAGLVNDIVGNVQNSVNQTVDGVLGGSGAGGGSPAPAPQPAPTPQPAPAPTPQDATTDPELDGTNPHGEGAVIDTTIENPLGEPIGVTVGQSRGDQAANGDYSGVVNILVLDNLPLIGDQTIGIATEEGESETSPIGPINDLLDDVCTAGDVCLAVLDYSSETTDNGSSNSFSAARADVLGETVAAEAVESEGNISDDGECQTANGSSTAADVGVGGPTAPISADLIESSSESTACQDGTETASGDSEVVNLGALQALDPLNLLGCDPTAVDDEFEVPLVVSGVCNGDDTNGSQADDPYNTRTAIQIDLLENVLAGIGADVDLDGSPSESRAIAPEDVDECPDPNNPDCDPSECPDPANPACDPDPECPNRFDPDCRDPNEPSDRANNGSGPGPGPGAGPTADTPGDLPFTGADIGTLGLIGAIVMGSGLGLMAVADRRRRTGT